MRCFSMGVFFSHTRNCNKMGIMRQFIKIDRGVIQNYQWIFVGLYTLLLPSAILIYRRLESAIGREATGKIPFYGVIIIGIAYVLYGYHKNKNCRHLLYLIPCGIISFIIIKYEPNPNKHIHIPEYVLMAWLLYAALSKDYRGKGIFILIFICGSLLGVVDELQQGLHPKRMYGWSDMAVNSSSTLIGVFTILGLTRRTELGWDWRVHLKEFRTQFGLILLGFVGAVFMCINLFQVQAMEIFWGIYPPWGLVWNIIFIVAVIIDGVLYSRKQRTNLPEKDSISQSLRQTARLWVHPILVILFVMHGIIILTAILGATFR